MNKENGIKRLNRLSVKAKEYRDENTQVVKLSQAIEVVELLDEPKPLTEDQAWKVIADVYNQDADRWKDAKNHYLNSLKEKEKPVVKQFVADWFEENKEELDNKIFYYCIDLNDAEKKYFEKFDEWFMDSNDSIETLIKMKDGYEVEKQKKYRIKSGSTYVWFNLDGGFRGVGKNSAVLTQERLNKLPFDVNKAADSGIIILEEVQNERS